MNHHNHDVQNLDGPPKEPRRFGGIATSEVIRIANQLFGDEGSFVTDIIRPYASGREIYEISVALNRRVKPLRADIEDAESAIVAEYLRTRPVPQDDAEAVRISSLQLGGDNIDLPRAV